MDIKPENILLCIDSNKDNSLDLDRSFSNSDNENIIFKLGKFRQLD